MTDQRLKKAKLNIVFSLASQAVAVVCGLIVPKIMIRTYGSEAYGATTSIAQFLGYISLLEAGVGGVARSAFYKPLADNDQHQISVVLYEIKRFFRVIGIIFAVYVLTLACAYKNIAHVECFDYLTTAMLVFAISISTFMQYFFGISNMVLLQAAQKAYITKILSMTTLVLNTIATLILVTLNCSIVTVKFVSSLVFCIRPIVLYYFVHKDFSIEKKTQRDARVLKQKWNGLGQHLAYFLHSNTDVAVLTLLDKLTTVSVYSVYHMVVTEIQNLAGSFSAGMEAVFGDMLAKKENNLLQRIFSYYETLISTIAIVLFSTTATMIIPFVRLYTASIADVNYIYPQFALIIVIASLLYCLRMPYHSMVIAAGHFKQTQFAAYGEAIINITVSVLLVVRFGLIGVAIGTVSAVLFRFIYYAMYLWKNVIHRDIHLFVKRVVVNSASFLIIVLCGYGLTSKAMIASYFQWIIFACIVTITAIIVQIIMILVFYRDDLKPIINKLFAKKKCKDDLAK